MFLTPTGDMPFKFALKTTEENKRPTDAKGEEPAKKPRASTPNVSSLVIMEKMPTPQRAQRLPTSADLVMCIYKALRAPCNVHHVVALQTTMIAGQRQSCRHLGHLQPRREALPDSIGSCGKTKYPIVIIFTAHV